MFSCLTCSLIASFGVYLVGIRLVLLLLLEKYLSGLSIAAQHLIDSFSIHASSIKFSKFVLILLDRQPNPSSKFFGVSVCSIDAR